MVVIIAAVPTILTDMAAIVGALAAICISVGVLVKLRPVRWLVEKAIVEPVGEWVIKKSTAANAPLMDKTETTAHLVQYHLGSNDTTMPWHERLSRLEVRVGLEPVAQQPEDN